MANIPYDPTPEDTAEDVSTDLIKLEWGAAGDEIPEGYEAGEITDLWYDVYFYSTTQTIPYDWLGWTQDTYFNLADAIDDPVILDSDTNYQWRVDVYWATIYDEDDRKGIVSESDTWSFTTESLVPSKAINPAPANTSTNITLDQAAITWEDGGGATSYNVYYGDTSGDLTLISEGQAGLSLTVTGITLGSPYGYLITRYWRIDSINAYGTTTGDEWSFTTMRFAPPLPTGVTIDDDGNPTGTPTGLNFISTTRKLVGVANSKVWIEDI